MKPVTVVVNGIAFLSELRFVARAVPQRSTIPILRNVLIEIKGRSLHLTATDLDVIAWSSVALVGPLSDQPSETASVTTPVELLVRAIANLIGDDPSPLLTLTVTDDDSYSLELEYEGAKVRVFGSSAADFPTLPEFPERLRGALPAAQFREAIRRVRFAVAKDETHFQIDRTLFEVGPKSTVLVSSDGHRLAIATIKAANDTQPKRLLPPRALDMLPLLDFDEIGFGERELYLYFGGDRRRLSVRITKPNFPNYREVIATDLDKRIVVEAEVMTVALRRVAAFVSPRYKALRIEISADTLTMKVEDYETGAASVSVAVDYAGPEFFIGLNLTFLRDFFAAVSGPVEMRMRDENGQAHFRVVGAKEECQCVVMPMRLGA